MMGNMIGAGIFIYPSLIASNLSHPILFLFIWVIGGLIAVCGALSSAELGSLFPEAGGDYVYLRNAYGKRWAFLYGFLTFTITFPGSIALGLTLTIYFQGTAIFGDWVRSSAFNVPLLGTVYYYQLIATGLLLFLTIVNYFGLGASILLQKITTLTPLAMLLFVSLSVIVFFIGDIFHFSEFQKGIFFSNMNVPIGKIDPLKIGAALVPVYWTYMGWNSPLSLGAELKEPARVIPRVMIFGPLFVMTIYFLFAFVFVSVIPYASIAEGKIDPYFLIGKHFVYMLHENPNAAESLIPKALSFLIALLVLGNVNSTILTGTRVSVALAQDGILPAKISYLDRKRKTPVYSLAAQSLWVLILIFFISKDSDLLNFSFIAITILSIMTVFSVFIFRLKKEQKLALYKTYLYPYTPLFYIIFSVCIIIAVILNYVFENNLSVILYSIISIVAGLLFFEIWKRVNREEIR